MTMVPDSSGSRSDFTFGQWLEKCKDYGRVVIWGDYDKKIDNIFAARKASEVLGKQVQSVITEKDPKYYNTEEICQFLNINI